jgi:general stress protein 26
LSDLESTALPFIEMAHRIVWASVATVDTKGRPRSRVLHPIWHFADGKLTGWVATGPTPTKRAHLEVTPHVSVNYWHPDQDTCVAECRATWHFDQETRDRVWDTFKNTPAPVGYDPAIIPGWSAPSDDAFAALRLDPWRLRVFPGTVLMKGEGEVKVWREGKT